MKNLPDRERDEGSSQINKTHTNTGWFLLIGCDKSEIPKFLEHFILNKPSIRYARTRLVRFPGGRQVASCCIVKGLGACAHFLLLILIKANVAKMK